MCYRSSIAYLFQKLSARWNIMKMKYKSRGFLCSFIAKMDLISLSTLTSTYLLQPRIPPGPLTWTHPVESPGPDRKPSFKIFGPIEGLVTCGGHGRQLRGRGRCATRPGGGEPKKFGPVRFG